MPPTDFFWSLFWTIPNDFPTGMLGYKVNATMNDGTVVTWQPFTRDTPQLMMWRARFRGRPFPERVAFQGDVYDDRSRPLSVWRLRFCAWRSRSTLRRPRPLRASGRW
jgi:hypothetical protein